MAFWHSTCGFGKTPKQKYHRKLQHKSRVYTDVNDNLPVNYWHYKGLSVPWTNSLENYEVVRQLGRGKYSEVYEAVNLTNDKKCVVKILKPVNKISIKREIQILQNLCGGTNIITMLDILRDKETRIPILVLEYIEAVQFKTLIPKISDFDIRYYTRQLLKALDYTHSNGIMHRDIKPGNVLIDHEKRTLRLIDWGLADFYHVHKDYSIRVGTKFYKAPELLVDMSDYDYGIDLWSTGCMVAAMIFKISPFFKGKDNSDQLVKVSGVLGTERLYEWMELFGLRLEDDVKGLVGFRTRVPWSFFVNEENQHVAHEGAMDFLDKLLRYDPRERLTAREALEHPYLVLELPMETAKGVKNKV